MHRTLKQETADPPKANLREQQRAFDAFREEYNHERPHAALDDQTPAECYVSSPRVYVGRLKPEEYPEGYEVRVVSEGGQIRWNRARVFVGRALEGERIGLELTEAGKWRVWFSFYELGELDEGRLVMIDKPLKKSSSRTQ